MRPIRTHVVVAWSVCVGEVHVGRRNVTGGLRATRTVTSGGRAGLRLLRYAVELARHHFRPSVDDAGRRLTCTAYVRDQPVNATSVRLVVRRKPLAR